MKATDQLLKDHKLIRKVLEDFSVDNPRFPQLFKTLARSVIGHAFFEDKIFLPAFEKEALLRKRFIDQISQEHTDMEYFLDLIRRTPSDQKKDIQAYTQQLQAILTTHLTKEEDALFPLTEKILDNEGLNQLGEEMERRKTDVRDLVADYR